MRHWQSFLAACVVLAGLAGSASAQQFGVAGMGGNAFAGNGGFAGNGFNTGFNNFGYNNFGGLNNNFGSNNFGYNRGYNYVAPQTYNNMGGLMNSIRTQTGRGNSYRYGYGPAVGGRRR